MSVADGAVLRVSARFKHLLSGDIVNVFHYDCAFASGPYDDSVVMDAVDDHLTTVYAPIATAIGQDTDPYDIRYDIVTMGLAGEELVRTLGTRTWVLGTPPSGTGDILPQMNAMILNLRTTVPGSFGRKYIGPILEAATGGGALTGSTLSALASAGAALASIFVVAGADFIEAGILTPKASTANKMAAFIGVVANAIIGTQRRRRINRGS
jgi:hypothetical protein